MPGLERYDEVIAEIAAYASMDEEVGSEDAYRTAYLCLMDSVGCALLANGFEECRRYIDPDADVELLDRQVGVRLPGLPYVMRSSDAAFAIATGIRWLDFNDTWLAKEWGHPSDNFGAILAVADSTARRLRYADAEKSVDPLRMRDLLDIAIRAYEIQGVLALDNAFNRVGIDHVLLVKVASAAVAAKMLSRNDSEVIASAVSHAWLDATLRAYRHAPNTGARKSWAAGDACERAVKLAIFAQRGMGGCHSALTAPRYGFQDAWFGGSRVSIERPFKSYVMENILFKVRYPAEFHGQTAIEAAIELHPRVADRIGEISEVRIETQDAGNRIINKEGALTNAADRDHCIQYMTAVALIKGDLVSEDYEDSAAGDSRIDALRGKMSVRENLQYSSEYLDPYRRSIANSVQVFFKDGSCTEEVEVRYPIGHRNRRREAESLLYEKFRQNVAHTYGDGAYAEKVIDLFDEPESTLEMPVERFMEILHLPSSGLEDDN